MLSERARQQWAAFALARTADTAPFGDRDELHRFLIGIHMRGEPLAAAELSALLDDVDLSAGERQELVSFVEWGLALLAAYDRVVEAEDEAYQECTDIGGIEV